MKKNKQLRLFCLDYRYCIMEPGIYSFYELIYLFASYISKLSYSGRGNLDWIKVIH